MPNHAKAIEAAARIESLEVMCEKLAGAVDALIDSSCGPTGFSGTRVPDGSVIRTAIEALTEYRSMKDGR